MEKKKLNIKKAKQFIENNFPPYNEITILEETDERVIALLDYGRREEKLRVTIGYTGDEYSLYKLLQTDFIK